MISDRETILEIIEAIGGDRRFWETTSTCQPAIAKAVAILRRAFAEVIADTERKAGIAPNRHTA